MEQIKNINLEVTLDEWNMINDTPVLRWLTPRQDLLNFEKVTIKFKVGAEQKGIFVATHRISTFGSLLNEASLMYGIINVYDYKTKNELAVATKLYNQEQRDDAEFSVFILENHINDGICS